MRAEPVGDVIARRFFFGAIALALAFAVDGSEVYRLVRWLIRYEQSGEVREAVLTTKFLASGLGTVLVGLVVATLDRLRWRRALVFWLVVAAATASGSALRGLVGRERPSHLDQRPGEERVWSFHGPRLGLRLAPFQSFPSGHTASAFAAATCLAGFYPPARAVLYTVAGAGGVGRVIKHQHFPSDVVAGAVLGHLLALWLLGRPRLKRWWDPDEVDRRSRDP